VTLCGWEGNHRSGVALAMRHRLSGPSTYRLNGLDREIMTLHKHHRGMALYLQLWELTKNVNPSITHTKKGSISMRQNLGEKKIRD